MVPGVTIGRWHRIVERYLQNSGVAWTILRPNGFMSNFDNFWGATIRSEQKLYLPLGNAKTSWIDPRDVGAVAAKVLTTPGHAGKVYELTGVDAIDTNQVVKVLSEVVGKPVQYIDVPETAAVDGMKKAGIPAWMVDGLSELYAVWKKGYAAPVTLDVEKVLNRKPITFAQWAKDNANKLKG